MNSSRLLFRSLIHTYKPPPTIPFQRSVFTNSLYPARFNPISFTISRTTSKMASSQAGKHGEFKADVPKQEQNLPG
jgi:hypothetical protein